MDSLSGAPLYSDPKPTTGLPPSPANMNPFGAQSNMTGVETPPPSIPSLFTAPGASMSGNPWAGASFNMTGVEGPAPSIPSMFQGMVSSPFPTPATATPSVTPPTPTPTSGAPISPTPSPVSPTPVPTPPPATPTASPTTPPVGAPTAGTSPFFVSGLGKVPSLNDFLQYMSYSSPREQGLKNILEDKGIFDKFSPYLQPGSTPGGWASGELGAYGPSHNLNPATSPFATGGSGTPFDGYDPEGLMQLLTDSGIVTGYSGTPGTPAPTTPGGTTPGTTPGTPTPGAPGSPLTGAPQVPNITAATQQLRDWDWSKGLPPALTPGDPLGKAMGWDNQVSMPTQWTGPTAMWGATGELPSSPSGVQPEPSPAPTEAPGVGSGVPPGATGAFGDLSGALGGAPPVEPPANMTPGEIPPSLQPGGGMFPLHPEGTPAANPNPYGTGTPQPQVIEDPNNAAYGPDHQLSLEDMGTPAFEQGASPQDRQYLAGLSYYFNPSSHDAWANALAWGVPGVPPVFSPTPGGAAPQGMYPGGGAFPLNP